MGIAQLARLLLEHLDEQPADDLAFGLRVALALQRIEKPLLGVDADHLHPERVGEGAHHLVAFAQAQQAVIDEHAGELLADGAMQQRRDHRGIHAARQAQQHPAGARPARARAPPDPR